MIFCYGIFASFINSHGFFASSSFQPAATIFWRAFFAQHRHDEGIELPFQLLVAHRIERVAKRIIDPLGQHATVLQSDMNDVRDRLGVNRAQLVVAFHLHVLQEFPDRRIRETLRLKLFLSHFAIDQRDAVM